MTEDLKELLYSQKDITLLSWFPRDGKLGLRDIIEHEDVYNAGPFFCPNSTAVESEIYVIPRRRIYESERNALNNCLKYRDLGYSANTCGILTILLTDLCLKGIIEPGVYIVKVD